VDAAQIMSWRIGENVIESIYEKHARNASGKNRGASSYYMFLIIYPKLNLYYYPKNADK
jgi:hypothetical protein